MSQVNYLDDYIIIKLIPPNFDDEIKKMNEKWEEHLDWVKGSLNEIFKTEKPRSIKSTGLLKTLSQKKTRKRNPSTIKSNDNLTSQEIGTIISQATTSRLTRSRSRLLKQLNFDQSYLKTETKFKNSKKEYVDKQMLKKNNKTSFIDTKEIKKDLEDDFKQLNISCHEMDISPVKESDNKVEDNYLDLNNSIENIENNNIENIENENTINKFEEKINEKNLKNLKLNDENFDDWITEDESSDNHIDDKTKTPVQNNIRKLCLKRCVNTKSNTKQQNTKRTKTAKINTPKMLNKLQIISKLPMKSWCSPKAKPNVILPKSDACLININGTKKINNLIKIASSQNLNCIVNKNNENNGLTTASSQSSLKSCSSAASSKDGVIGKAITRCFGESTLKQKLDEEKKRKNLEKKIAKEIEAKTKKENFLKQKQEEMKQKREERERRVREARKQNALEECKKNQIKKKQNLAVKEKQPDEVDVIDNFEKEIDKPKQIEENLIEKKLKNDNLPENKLILENKNLNVTKIIVNKAEEERRIPEFPNASIIDFTINKSSLSSTFIKSNDEERKKNNYDISDLKSDDDTDDDRNPRKTIPVWAKGAYFISLIKEQYSQPFKIREKSIKYLFSIDDGILLDEIFANCTEHVSQKYLKRTSSAYWDSPPLTYIDKSFSKEAQF